MNIENICYFISSCAGTVAGGFLVVYCLCKSVNFFFSWLDYKLKYLKEGCKNESKNYR